MKSFFVGEYMSLISAGIFFGIIVIVLVVYINRTPWNAEELWERRQTRLRAQGIIEQRPADWEYQVQKQRSRFIYSVLAFVVVIAAWFVWSICRADAL